VRGLIAAGDSQLLRRPRRWLWAALLTGKYANVPSSGANRLKLARGRRSSRRRTHLKSLTASKRHGICVDELDGKRAEAGRGHLHMSVAAITAMHLVQSDEVVIVI
jgi:hypothetical protein